MPTETDLHSRLAVSRGFSTKSAWVSARRGAFHWDIQESFRDEWLDEKGQIPINPWLAEGLASIVKSGPHRAVYRLMLPMGIFYLKHYRAPDWQAVLQNLIRPCKADLEWRAAQKISRQGLKTFETVAVGRRRQYGVVTDNYLITREIADAEPLDEYVLKTFPSLSLDQQRADRREIAKRLGEMTARLHLGGLLHRDLHPGNVLVQKHADRWQLHLIDLHALSEKRKLSLSQIGRNLSLLNNFFARLTSNSDRQRFLNAYADVWNRNVSRTFPLDRNAVRCVERICQAELEKADSRGDKKWRRGNRRLIILENPPNRCRGLAGLGRKQLQEFQALPENLFEESRLIAWRNREQSPRRAVIELTLEKTPVRAIVTAFPRENLARNAWEMGHALIRRRLPVPRPLLFVETERGDGDYLVVEEIPGAVLLKQRISDRLTRFSEPRQEVWMNSLLTEAASQLRRLHDHGFHQPNLSLSSILIHEDAKRTRLWFVSLEHFQKLPRVDSRRAIESLAVCWRSWPTGFRPRSSQRLRFLRTYLGFRFSADWKTYWRGIASLALGFPNTEAA